MNTRLWSTELGEHVGERVQLYGWLHHLRRLSSVTFLILRDAKGLTQIVVEDPALIETLAALHHESALGVTGTVIANPQAPNGREVRAESVEVISGAVCPTPFDLFRPTLNAQLPTLLDYAPISLRHPKRRAMFHINAASAAGFRRTLTELSFVEIHTPKLVASATEGGANVFPVEYFGQTAYLAQSPQFYKQMMVGVFERVFEVGPVFRAEPHDTTRHLNQYESLDVEMGFIENHHTVIRVVEKVVRGMLESVQAHAADALTLAEVTLPSLPETIPSIPFWEAQELIFRETGEDCRHEPDLEPKHERWLGEWAKREYNSDFLFVEGYPMVKRPFYTHPNPSRPEYSNSFDLLFRGLELMTGGQRLHRYEDYLAALAARGLDPEPFAPYLQTFQYGMPPHGGFAIGLERWTARLAEVGNVREAALFPRDMQRLTP